MSRFYKAEEELNLRFYQMPKALFNNKKYKGLSLGAKAMYSILRDRQDLSIKNKWVDEDGYIYLLFKIEPAKDDERTVEEKEPRELSLMEILEVDRKTVMKYKKELVKYNLIVDKRMGQGKTNRMYILKPELPSNVEKYEKSKKRTSGSPKNGPQEVQKLDGNDTDFIDTDFIDTQSVENDRLKKQHEFICGKCQLYLFEDVKDMKLIENAILDLMYLREVNVKNRVYNNEEIMDKLNELDFNVCDYALNKFKGAKNNTYIKNKTKYFSILLFNAIEEYYAN